MTRNAQFLFSSPPRRVSGMSALLAVAVLSGALGGSTVSTASAQSADDSPEIRQVANKRSGGSNYSRSGGLLGGLFGRSSPDSKSKEPYRRATAVPSDNDVNWNGIPYHDPTGGRSASKNPMPIRDPGAGSRQNATSQPSRAPVPSAETAPSSRSSSSVPAPRIAQSTPRRLNSSPDASPNNSLDSSLAEVPIGGNRPEPLSVSSSSRRPMSVEPSKSQPTRLESRTPTLVEKSPVSTRSSESSAELVPKVSRRVLASNGPVSKPAPVVKKNEVAKTEVAKVEPVKPEPKPEAMEAAPQVVRREATPVEQPAPKVVAQPLKKNAPASQIAAATPAPVAPATVAPATVASATVAPAKVASAPVASAPVASAPVASAPVASAKVASAPVVPAKVASAPVTPALAMLDVAATAPSESATMMMGKMTFGDARQSVSTSNTALSSASDSAIASLGAPHANPSKTSAGMSLPGQTAVQSAPSQAANRMNSSGNNVVGGRAAGSLATSASSDVALHPISDRLPIDGQNESPDGMQTQHDSMFTSHNDTFSQRTASTSTQPNYQSVAHGPGTQPNRTFAVDTAPQNTSPGHPNVMRDTSGATATPANNAAPTAANPMTRAATNAVPDANTNTTSTDLPVIRIMTAGPRNVMIRQTHSYEIRVENRGSVDAEGLIIRAHIPDWGDVVGQQVSRGDVQGATEKQVRSLNWRIETLAAGDSETMFVRLKASRSGTHDLDVDWTLAPQKRVMQVTVQEPQLALTIDGPDEVIYGESKTYQIRVLNPGDGIAPAVVFTLSPESNSPQSQRIGDIPAGKEAQFEVELTAQDLGELKIHGLAMGDLELKAEADKTVRVLAADLEAVLTGPEVKYQDTQAVYQLELTNHGTTASNDVVANLQLPMGVTYQGGMEGATIIDKQLRWKIASLTPGAVRKYQFQCRMDGTGTHQFAFDCKGSAAGQTSVKLDTNVEAIADLVLSIVDPSAPAPIGEDVTYQIVIRNRGSKPAHDVQAVAQFSHGIEPKQISGHVGKVITGQVLIEPIPKIDAGEEVRMTIVARAETGGHHRFRTEVRSGDTVLVAEEATHYLAPQNDRITRRSGPGGNEFSLPLR